MNKSKDMNGQLSRMKSLMTFGLNEGKNVAYTGVEYEKVGADGKLYGIVREGAKYYIKTSQNKKGKLAENFDYIGGFRNRKSYEYTSFADAQKNFDLKMMSINEANAPEKKIVVESWNPDKQEMLTVESTDKMRREISRERQIMLNASRINERKEQNLKPINEACESKECGEAEGYNFKDAVKPKNNISNEKHKEGKAADANGDYEEAKIEESSQPLTSRDTDDDYLDTQHGTKIGDTAPFNDARGKQIDDTEGTSTTGKMKNGVVNEGESMAMDNGDNQNSPAVGTGEIGDDAPFDDEKGKQLTTEDLDDVNGDADVEDDAALGDEEGLEGEDDFADEDGLDSEDEYDVYSDSDTDPDLHDLESQIGDLRDMISSIADAVGADVPSVDTEKYADDDLYGDDDEDLDDEEEPTVYESRAFRQMRINETKKAARFRRLNEEGMKPFSDNGRVPSGNMNKLDMFGKHPAYQKKVMSLPTTDHQEKEGYYDMNDNSVRNTAPYGKKIGSSAPFEVDPEEVENAIAESIKRNMGKLLR